MKTSKFKPFFLILLLLSFLCLGLIGCSKEEAKTTEAKEESQKAGETEKPRRKKQLLLRLVLPEKPKRLV